MAFQSAGWKVVYAGPFQIASGLPTDGSLFPEEGRDVPTPANDSQYQHFVISGRAINHNVVAHREASVSKSQVIAPPPQIRVSRQPGKEDGETIEEMVGTLSVLALCGNV